MRFLPVLFFVICIVCNAFAAAGEQTGRFHSLVIGVNDYRHLKDLETAVNDASAVHDLLRRSYGFHSTLLLNPNREQLVRAIDRIRTTLGPEDNVLVFYAGHGTIDRPSGEGFWLPVDAEEESRVNWVATSTVARTLRASVANHALVIADSCFSGTLTRNIAASVASGKARKAEIERLAGKRARKAMTSGGLEPVDDGGGDGHSPFTRSLLEILRENRRILGGAELYLKLRPKVVKKTAATPSYGAIRMAGDEDGDFLFIPLKLEPNAPERPAAGARDVELAFWRSVQKNDRSEDYHAYLKSFPEGTFRPLALSRLEALEGQPKRRPNPTGTWQSEPIAKRRNGTYRYRFEFKTIGHRLFGEVVELDGRREYRNGILDGTVSDKQISFRTRHRWEVYDAERRQVEASGMRDRQYVGVFEDGRLRMIEQFEGLSGPVEFFADRIGE